MDDASSFASFGVARPGPGHLFGVLIFSLVGLAAFRYGRKADRSRTLWIGVVLMLYPYAISRTWLLYAVGVALCIGIWLDHR